jgi:hypothetical protein
MAIDLLDRRPAPSLEAHIRWRRLSDDDTDTRRRRDRDEIHDSSRRTREEVRHEVDGLYRRDG